MPKTPDLWNRIAASVTDERGITILGKGDAEESRSFRTIAEQAQQVAGALWDQGIRPGDRIGLIPDTNFSFVIGCIAAWRLGSTAVSLPPPSRLVSLEAWLEQTGRRIEKATVKTLLIDERQMGFPAPVPTHLVSELHSETRPPECQDPGPALVQFTSGSTGDPRGIVLSHAAVLGHMDAFEERVKIGGERRVFNWLPLYHDLGLIDFTLWPLCYGYDLTMLPPQLFLAEPARWLTGMSRTRATHSAGPNFAYGLVTRFAEKGLSEEVDLSNVKVLGCGGEVVDAETILRFTQATESLKLNPGAFSVGYGMAEVVCANITRIPGTGLLVDTVDRDSLGKGTATPTEPGAPRAARFSSCGVPMVDTEVVIDGAEGRDRHVGEILIRCPYLMDGFLDDPEATAQVVMPDGWFRTGDLGYLVDGELYVTGRSKDVIIIRGYNYYAEDIERVIQDVSGLRRGNIIAFGARNGSTEHLVIVAESKLQDEEELRTVRDEVSARILENVGVAPQEVLLLPPGSVPKTSSGKLQRRQMRDSHAEGHITA